MLTGPAWLFCPADRPDRYRRALASSDVVILDLEDAVAADRKGLAREALRDLDLDRDHTVVRLNPVDSPEHASDLALMEELGVATVMLAKAEGAVGLDGFEVIALVETARGVEALPQIVGSPSVVGLMWGADDLVASLGGTASRRPDGGYRDVARDVRNRVLLAGKAADRFVLDAVYMDIPDLAGLRDEAEDAVAVGFDGKVAIHPSQVPVIRDAYRPSAEQLSWARGVLAAGAAGGVATYQGRMVDGPIFHQAERIVRLAADPA